MDVREYIESGILESYALGMVSPQEKQEVECMSHIYPEIGEELRRLQSGFEELALRDAQAPPPALKGQIFAAIRAEQEQVTTAPASPEETRMRTLIPDNAAQTPPAGNRSYSLALVASIALLLGVAGMYWSKNAEVSHLSARVAAVNTEKDSLSRQLADLGEQHAHASHAVALLKDPAVKTVYLKGVEATSPGSNAVVCWHSTQKTVHLAVDSLPPVPDGKQYQLWAIVDGQPADMGVFALDPESKHFQDLPVTVDNPQAFAITLEKEGGSPVPSLDQMYVVGGI